MILRLFFSIAVLVLLFAAAVYAHREYIGEDRLHAILRPDLNGAWQIQDDDFHAPHGIAALVQDEGGISIGFSRKYPKAGTVQITTDDGFGPFVSAHATLGNGSARIVIFADGQIIDPRTIWEHLPPDKREQHNGNLWINVTMIK